MLLDSVENRICQGMENFNSRSALDPHKSIRSEHLAYTECLCLRDGTCPRMSCNIDTPLFSHLHGDAQIGLQVVAIVAVEGAVPVFIALGTHEYN